MNSQGILVYTTTANMAAGFDKLGAKLNFSPTKAVATLIPTNTGIDVRRTGNYDVPNDILPEEQTVASKAYRLLCDDFGDIQFKDFGKIKDIGFLLELEGNIPPGGTGSSGADGIAVIELLNSLFGLSLNIYQKLAYARAAEDGNHIDNVLPGIVGGITVLKSPLGSDPIKYEKIADPGFAYGLLVPTHLRKEGGTSGTRSNLAKPEIDRLDKLTSGLKSRDFAQVSTAMREYDQHPSSITSQRNQRGVYQIDVARLSNRVNDAFHERVVMTPSGSGPTMFFMGSNGNDVAEAMALIVEQYGQKGHEATGNLVTIREEPSSEDLEDIIAA